MASQKLFHISPGKNRASIAKSGVDPIWSRGKTNTSWWVDQTMIAWALAHCSARHNLPVDKLEVWYRDAPSARNMKRSRWRGVYYTYCRNTTEGVYRSDVVLEKIAAGEVL